MLKALLSHFHQNENLLRFLPKQEFSAIQQLPLLSQPIDFSSLLSSKKWIKSIHFSWFEAPLQKLPKEMLPLSLSLFSAHQAKGLSSLFNIEPTTRAPHFTQLFIADLLKRELFSKEILPQELLPASKMTALLALPQKQLIYLIDFLGLYDLATDLRQIVDKQLINKIHGVLKEEQKLFLAHCSQQPTKWISPKMGLSGWNGNEESLLALVHQRGLIRLAKGAIDENESFKWHLIHHLDLHRGKLLAEQLQNRVDNALIPYFKGQIFDILRRFR